MSAQERPSSSLTKCLVISCPNIEDNSHTYTFFNFPTSRELTKRWKEKCGVSACHDVTEAKVCSNHFNNASYSNKTRKKLKPDAVPNQNLDWMFGAPSVEFDEKARKANPIRINTPDLDVSEASDKDTPKEALIDDDMRYDVISAVNENEKLKAKLAMLTEEYGDILKKIMVYDTKLENLWKEIDKVEESIFEKTGTKSMCKTETDVITKVFSPAQIDVLKGKKKVVWSNDDMAMAFSLRHIGNRESYLYLKDVLNMPLPSLSSVQKWAASVD